MRKNRLPTDPEYEVKKYSGYHAEKSAKERHKNIRYYLLLFFLAALNGIAQGVFFFFLN